MSGAAPLPSLEEPEPGTCCPHCAEPMVLEGFCGECYERETTRLEMRRRIAADLALARKRARTWQLAKAAQQ